jgi:hypothetical protein
MVASPTQKARSGVQGMANRPAQTASNLRVNSSDPLGRGRSLLAISKRDPKGRVQRGLESSEGIGSEVAVGCHPRRHQGMGHRRTSSWRYGSAYPAREPSHNYTPPTTRRGSAPKHGSRESRAAGFGAPRLWTTTSPTGTSAVAGTLLRYVIRPRAFTSLPLLDSLPLAARNHYFGRRECDFRCDFQPAR